VIKIDQQEQDFPSRKEYLVALAIRFIKVNTWDLGDKRIFYDEAVCDGFCLANDLMIEFDFDKEDVL
jgi:hypothetical protein